MVQSKEKIETLTPFQKKVLAAYQKYSVKYRVANKNAHVTIRKGFMDWLAQPVRREAYDLEIMPVHEQVALIDSIVDHLQARRTEKATDTRTKTKKYTAKIANKARQTSFEL